MGINKIQKRPVIRTIDGEERIVARYMMYLSLSADHRLVDGAEAAQFVNTVTEMLENPNNLFLT